jgi:hypothetical protein
MTNEDAQVRKDKEQLDKLEKDIEKARQDFKNMEFKEEESFIEETSQGADVPDSEKK